jgi:hypothetical protein
MPIFSFSDAAFVSHINTVVAFVSMRHSSVNAHSLNRSEVCRVRELIDALIDDDDTAALRIIDKMPDGPNAVLTSWIFRSLPWKLPKYLIFDPPLFCVAAWLGAINCLKLYTNLSADYRLEDRLGGGVAHYAAAPGSFDCCR